MVEKKRLVAAKVPIAALTKGKWVPRTSASPNYVLTAEGLRVGRARILATVVNKWTSQDKKFCSITLDDGTDTIRAKAFNSLIFDSIKVGDIIEIVGKVKYYGDELYVAPETMWKSDANAELLRELEIRALRGMWDKKRNLVINYQKQVSDLGELKHLAAEMGIEPEDVEAIIEGQELGEERTVGKEEVKAKVLELIAGLDRGDGCDYGELMQNAGLAEAALDSTVQELLEEGTCFEPRPGKIKRL